MKGAPKQTIKNKNNQHQQKTNNKKNLTKKTPKTKNNN